MLNSHEVLINVICSLKLLWLNFGFGFQEIEIEQKYCRIKKKKKKNYSKETKNKEKDYLKNWKLVDWDINESKSLPL